MSNPAITLVQGPEQARKAFVFCENDRDIQYPLFKRDWFNQWLMPVLFQNGDLIQPKGRLGLCHSKIGGRCLALAKGSSTTVLEGLEKRLKPFMRHRMVKVLLSRNVHYLKRLDQQVAGIVDSLMLYDFNLFSISNQKSMRKLLLKLYSIGSFNGGISLIADYWKAFTNFVYIRTCKLEVNENPHLQVENVFRRLLTYPPLLRSMENGLTCKPEASGIAHLLSTRQLVPGDDKVMEKAMWQFLETTSKPATLSEDAESVFYQEGYAIARYLTPLIPKGILEVTPHMSMNNAASFDSSVEDGGRASDIVKCIYKWLIVVPHYDETIFTPLGALKCPGGYARWRSWCRKTVLIKDELTSVFVSNDDFLRVKEKDFTNTVADRLWGADEVLGLQILNIAYLEAIASGYMSEKGIVLKPLLARVICVPEPGNKSRIVTTTMWWNNVLQQPIGHLLRKTLEFHSAAKAGLKRTDQAWQFVKIPPNVDLSLCGEDFYALSSDLKEATDALDPKLMEIMLQAYFIGLGISGPLIDTAISLVTSPRKFLTGDIFIPNFPLFWIKVRGVMMGEAMTKGILALYGLVCEQAALRQFLGSPTYIVSPPWRYFAIGGDDHLVVGPKAYCSAVTERHLKSGSKLSAGKHGLSSLAVKYCERLIIVKSLQTFKYDYKDFNTFRWEYPFVDSIKVRLLAPSSTTVVTRDDHNAAIGKGTSLGATFQYLPDYLDRKWRVIVRERFFVRMGSYLPKKGGVHKRLFYQLLLPQSLGGLGLYINDDEFALALNNAPLILKFLLYCAQHKEELQDVDYFLDRGLSILRKWLTYGSFRAYTSDSFEGETIRAYDLEQAIRDTLECCTYWEAVANLSPIERNQVFVNDSIRIRGLMPIADLVLLLQKGYLFQNILLGTAEQNSFKTMNLSLRYEKIWSIVEKCTIPLLSQIISVLDYQDDLVVLDPKFFARYKKEQNNSLLYVQVDKPIIIDYFSIADNKQIHIENSVLETVTNGLPLLSIKLSEVALYKI